MPRATTRVAIFWFLAPLPVFASMIQSVGDRVCINFAALAGVGGGFIVITWITGLALLCAPEGPTRWFTAFSSVVVAFAAGLRLFLPFFLPHASGGDAFFPLWEIGCLVLAIVTLVISLNPTYWTPSRR